jgi:hypothetical protein
VDPCAFFWDTRAGLAAENHRQLPTMAFWTKVPFPLDSPLGALYKLHAIRLPALLERPMPR